MQGERTRLLNDVADYYATKLAEHGDTPHGVDWNGEEGQFLRFEQLTRIIAGDALSFSIVDLGCGYGALIEYLRGKFSSFQFTGVDVAEDMVQAAQQRYGDDESTRFIVGSEPDGVVDYVVASGIFNVRMGRTDAEWLDHVKATLDVMDRTSRRGFAFNCLTAYSDAEKMRDTLYYADPCRLFDLCKRQFSRNVALLHDYGLYEFTILVRK
ncbi:class I SAM-dependent methyltransferase [Cupriavidus campinensis]